MLTSNRMNHSVLTLWHAQCTRTLYPQFLDWGFSPKVRIKLVAARLLFQVEQVRCRKDCEIAAMHVALCHCERCDSLKSLNCLAFSICSVTSCSYSSCTMKCAMLSCCTTDARWFSPCRLFAEFIGDGQTGSAPWNHFNRYCRRTMHPPAIQWFCGITTAACTGKWSLWRPGKLFVKASK